MMLGHVCTHGAAGYTNKDNEQASCLVGWELSFLLSYEVLDESLSPFSILVALTFQKNRWRWGDR